MEKETINSSILSQGFYEDINKEIPETYKTLARSIIIQAIKDLCLPHIPMVDKKSALHFVYGTGSSLIQKWRVYICDIAGISPDLLKTFVLRTKEEMLEEKKRAIEEMLRSGRYTLFQISQKVRTNYHIIGQVKEQMMHEGWKPIIKNALPEDKKRAIIAGIKADKPKKQIAKEVGVGINTVYVYWHKYLLAQKDNTNETKI